MMEIQKDFTILTKVKSYVLMNAIRMNLLYSRVQDINVQQTLLLLLMFLNINPRSCPDADGETYKGKDICRKNC